MWWRGTVPGCRVARVWRTKAATTSRTTAATPSAATATPTAATRRRNCCAALRSGLTEFFPLDCAPFWCGSGQNYSPGIYKVVLPFWFVTVVPAERVECLRKVPIASHPCKVLHNYKKKQLIRVDWNLVGRLTYRLSEVFSVLNSGLTLVVTCKLWEWNGNWVLTASQPWRLYRETFFSLGKIESTLTEIQL